MIKEISLQIKKELLKAGAEEVVVATTKQNGSQIKFVNNKIAKTGTEELVNSAVFIVKNKKILFTSFKIKDLSELREKSKKLIEFANYLPINENYYGIAQGPFRYKKLEKIFDPKMKNLKEKAVDFIEEGINLALSKGAKRASGNFEFYSFEHFTTSSHHVDFQEKGTSWYYSIRALVTPNASGHQVACGRIFDPEKTRRAAEKAGEIAKESLNPKPGGEGCFDLIFEPLPLADLFNSVGIAASVFEVESGLSFLTKLNEKIGSDELIFIDDATIPDGFNSTAADEEGFPTQKNIIIEKGILKTYLHNTSTARKYQTKTTANAGLISPRPWNLIVQPGEYKKEELFKEVRQGIYVTNIWYTRFQNFQTGEFSTLPRDGIFLIKNGEIKYPIKEIRINSTMPEFLKNISALGKEQSQIKSWEANIPTFTPMILVKNIKITRPK